MKVRLQREEGAWPKRLAHSCFVLRGQPGSTMIGEVKLYSRQRQWKNITSTSHQLAPYQSTRSHSSPSNPLRVCIPRFITTHSKIENFFPKTKKKKKTQKRRNRIQNPILFCVQNLLSSLSASTSYASLPDGPEFDLTRPSCVFGLGGGDVLNGKSRTCNRSDMVNNSDLRYQVCIRGNPEPRCRFGRLLCRCRRSASTIPYSHYFCQGMCQCI